MSETTIAAETTPAETSVEPPAPAPVAPVDAPATVETPSDAEPTATETGPDLAAEVEKWKALSKKNEARAKANADKALEFDKIEEANKTEQQRLLERAEKAEQERNELQTLATRAEKSASTGVPMSAIPDGTEEQMDEAIAAFKGALASAVAEALKARPSAAAPAQIVTATPESTKVKQITSRTELQSMTPQQILDAQRDGRLDGLMGKSS
jgi:hypothetical protein